MDAEGAFTKPEGTPDMVEGDTPLAPRFTKADESQDVKDLNRYGQRNLYLILLKKEGGK
jgi:hypothetical protein